MLLQRETRPPFQMKYVGNKKAAIPSRITANNMYLLSFGG